MYDPILGRWLSVDPKRVEFSPYLGMGNSPINYVDPDGQDKITAIIFNSGSDNKFGVLLNYDTETGVGSITGISQINDVLTFVDLSTTSSNIDLIQNALNAVSALLTGTGGVATVDDAVNFITEINEIAHVGSDKLVEVPLLLGGGAVKDKMIESMGEKLGRWGYDIFVASEGSLEIFKEADQSGLSKVLEVIQQGNEGQTFRLRFNDIKALELDVLFNRLDVKNVESINAILDYSVSNENDN